MTIDRAQFRDNYRYALAVASEAIAPVLRIMARSRSRSGPAAPPEWRSGVILGNGHIGDALFRTCSLELLATALPNCRWSYLTTPSGAAVLAHNPALAEVLPWNDGSAADSLSPRRITELADRRFDVALCSENFEHYRALLLALRAGIPNRVAFTQKGLSGLTTMGAELPGLLPHAAQFRYMVERVTGERDTTSLRPRIFPDRSDVSAAAAEWSRLNLGEKELVIACSATTMQSMSACPPQLFTDVLHRVLEKTPEVHILLTGVASDRAILDSIAQDIGERAHVSAGVLTVLEFGAMLRYCSAFFGTDSGARHLANAASIPVFFIRNMGTSAIETGVYCPSETDIAPPGDYLNALQRARAFECIDRDAAAANLIVAARRQGRGSYGDTPR